MNNRLTKQKTKSFGNSKMRTNSQSRIERTNSPDNSQGYSERNTQKYKVRFKRKQLQQFRPSEYVKGGLSIDDVIDLKQVFDTYDSTGMGVLLPNDLSLLLNQNGFKPNKETVYEIIAQFDVQQAGGISFRQFLEAMHSQPKQKQSKKFLMQIFKKYDRTNKGFIDIKDLKQVNRHVKQNLDDETLKLMLQKCAKKREGNISFEEFYAIMITDIY